jgi:U4/U6 small nuclear ribonucleoprotein PRP31
MSTLADEFLRDFGAPDEEQPVEENDEAGDLEDVSMPGIEEEALAASFQKKNSSQMDLDEDTLRALTRARSVFDLAKLYQGSELPELMKDIENQKKKLMEEGGVVLTSEVHRVLEEDPEYEVITRGNDMMTSIGQEITVIHRFVQDIYRSRWPELENLVPNVMDYVRCIKKLGNNLLLARQELSELLPSASIISLSVAASNTTGQALSDFDLNRVLEACDVVLSLDASRQTIVSYIESRMKFYAPNLSNLIGTKIAAQLITIAGGLTNLGRNVSGNLQAMGIAKKGSLNGMSTSTSLGHVGFIVESDLIQRCPQALFKKAYRLVSGKCMIAARVDSFHSCPTGTVGAMLRAEVESKIDKWQEPPPARKEKPLPLPEFQKRGRHRAGRKVQAKKASYAMTELRKRANRVAFGQLSEEIGNEPDRDLGMLSQEGHGLLRIASNLENKGFKIKAPKPEKKKGQSKRDWIASTSSGAPKVLTSGAPQSSDLRTMVHTAEQQAQSLQSRLDALKSSNAGYFSSIGGFSSVIKK